MAELRRLCSLRTEFVFGVAAMGLACASAGVALKAWKAYLHVPLAYRDDANLNLMIVKGVLENGWYLENSRLGAPLGQQLYDYPVVSGDNLNVVLLLLLGVAVDDAAAVMNLFFLLTFALTALSAYIVIRLLGPAPGAALVCACLYALLPYHFLRGEMHFLLSAYYAVPLASYLILLVLRGEPLFKHVGEKRHSALAFASKRTLATLLICGVVANASGSFYYAGFAIVLLSAAVLLRLVVNGPSRDVATGALAAALIISLSLVNTVPTLVYEARHGENPQAAERQPFESEYYSLKLTQLVLPIPNHRVEGLREFRASYDAWTQSTGVPATEADLAALGLIATLGFVGIVGATLAAGASGGLRKPAAIYRHAGAAALVAFLVATLGGISSVIGMITPELRAWNRLSIFIGFFAFVGVAAMLDSVGARSPAGWRRRAVSAVTLAAVFVVGVLDQTGTLSPRYEETAAEWGRDHAFVRAIEERVAEETSILQIPYASFPEAVPPPPGRTVVYDFVRPYLHSKTLRWSFGAMRGRSADWAAGLADAPLGRVVRVASALGFGGIYVDLMGYDNDAVAARAEQELVAIVGQQPLRSDDGHLLFFDLREYNHKLRRAVPPEELEALRAGSLGRGQ